MEEYLLSSEQASRDFAVDFASKAKAEHPVGRAMVLALSGDLGTGKTFFVKSLARELGVSETITSPTFVLARFYDLPENSSWQRLIHIDAYRLEKVDELIKLGWSDWINDPAYLICIEWPEQIFTNKELEKFKQIHFSWVNETTRQIKV